MSVGDRSASMSWIHNGLGRRAAGRETPCIEGIPRGRRNWIRTLSRFPRLRFVADTETSLFKRKETRGMKAIFHDPVYISGL
ncbi:hypothetical protein [Burkholderia sp. SRS-W-2-2016]|uniref:hypothetical protein n=1 Tax=Burkholderia sp. SRS-W-2-2016 TaxID=1926878 RepID=UPI00117DBC1F|nr:hypothetical protein [Burkholderia sp. SRS-W-2-2016]